MQQQVKYLQGQYIGPYMQQLKNEEGEIVGKRRVRYVIVVALRIYHFARLVGIVINEFIGRVIVIHNGVVVVFFNTVIVPNLHNAQSGSRTKLVVLT
jgi:hypothetical protein